MGGDDTSGAMWETDFIFSTEVVGGSYYFIPESAMDSPPYTLLGTQALDGIGMQLLWVSDILLSFICSVIWLII